MALTSIVTKYSRGRPSKRDGGKSSERGAALVEGAFVLTIFVLIVFGIIQFSYVIYGYNALVYAARAGTRYAVVHGSSSPSPCTAGMVRQQVLNQLQGFTPNSVTVTTIWTPDNAPGSQVRVTVAANFTPIVTLVMNQGLTLASSSQMLILQ